MMSYRWMPVVLVCLSALTLLMTMRAVSAQDKPATSPSDAPGQPQRFYELRTYTTVDGRLDALKARFRDHTIGLFEKHGMTVVGFWTPADAPASGNTLVYLMAYPSREAREKSWKEFQADPDWQKAKADSERDGKIVEKVVSVYLNPTDFSPMK